MPGWDTFASQACQSRQIVTDIHGEAGEELSAKDYHRIADLTLGEILSSLETLIDDIPDISDPDLEYSQVGFFPQSIHSTIRKLNRCPRCSDWNSSGL